MRNPLFGEAAAPRSHESGLGSRGKSQAQPLRSNSHTFFAEKMPNCGGGEETQERDLRAEDQNIHHHKGGPVLSN